MEPTSAARLLCFGIGMETMEFDSRRWNLIPEYQNLKLRSILGRRATLQAGWLIILN